MLDIKVTVQGDKVVIANLQGLATRMPNAIKRGLHRIAKEVHRDATAWLSGPGGLAKKQQITGPSRGFSKKSGEHVAFSAQYQGAGGYPVPVRTGNLRRMLNWLKPGETKTGEAGIFTAGPMEVVIYNPALYANTIHQGTGSSAKFGARPFLTDAFAKFNRGARVAKILQEEIAAETARH